MPLFQLGGASDTCVFPIFGAWPSSTGELPFLPPRASQSQVAPTETQKRASTWWNAAESEI